ncbi:MAG: thiamine pyrophosphate-binding protein [Hyphomicrobiales bacterium]|nr:thiamine pyrophosphate-binding protein [Hyphomicrobiales bacterium]
MTQELDEAPPEMLRNEPEGLEAPIPSDDAGVWGSDIAADMMRALDIPYVSLNPGASFRGLHDSIVNRLGNRRPQMLLCLHEESAVAIAHGWAKVTGKPMMSIVHSNVGLMHATMAVFNAWCDRMPLLLFGATGPVDAARRRPWIDWIHTCKDQGSLVRDYTKWDDEPMSPKALQESILRARQIVETAPRGPAYICLDVGMQETKVEPPLPLPDLTRYMPPEPMAPQPKAVVEVAALLHEAERPVILMGRVSRDMNAWKDRVALAERLGAVVLTDLKLAGSFPNEHPLHGAPAGSRIGKKGAEVMRDADVVLSLEWRDLAGTLNTAYGDDAPTAKIIRVAVDQHSHKAWVMDYMGLPAADRYIMAEPEPMVSALLAELDKLGPRRAPAWKDRKPETKKPMPSLAGDGNITVPHVAAALQSVLTGRDVCLTHPPLSWAGELWPIAHPLDFLGGDGGGGIGGGPGQSIGAALALRGTGRLALAICGDGDFLMGVTAIWTAVHYKIPILFVICNNHAYYNDVLHQEHLAIERGRPPENKWIGQEMQGPELDLPTLARGQGAAGFGQVLKLADLEKTIREALAIVEGGGVAVVDVRVAAGYEEKGHAEPPAIAR